MENYKKIINGKELKCLFCNNNTFIEAQTILNRSLLATLNWEYLGVLTKRGIGTAYICKNCGYKHEFFQDMPKDRKERMKKLGFNFKIPELVLGR